MSDPQHFVVWSMIDDVQREITRWADEQFPGRTDHQTVFKLMVHEIPELMTHKKEKGTEDIGTELADCFILLMDLASMWGVNLTDAIRAKMEINYRRTWERDAHGIMQHVKMPPVAPAPDSALCPYCQSSSHVVRVEPNTVMPTKRCSPNDTHVCNNCNMGFDDSVPF